VKKVVDFLADKKYFVWGTFFGSQYQAATNPRQATSLT
jgi:hypothetical protein